MLPSGAMNRSICEPSAKVRVPVQSALTVYVPETGSLRETSPLKLEEATPFSLPLPSNTAYPAMANGTWALSPVISTPSKANGYVPCNVATEHFLAPAFSSSVAYPVPTAKTATTPTRRSTTHAAHSTLRFILILLLQRAGLGEAPLRCTTGPSMRGYKICRNCREFLFYEVR